MGSKAKRKGETDGTRSQSVGASTHAPVRVSPASTRTRSTTAKRSSQLGALRDAETLLSARSDSASTARVAGLSTDSQSTSSNAADAMIDAQVWSRAFISLQQRQALTSLRYQYPVGQLIGSHQRRNPLLPAPAAIAHLHDIQTFQQATLNALPHSTPGLAGISHGTFVPEVAVTTQGVSPPATLATPAVLPPSEGNTNDDRKPAADPPAAPMTDYAKKMDEIKARPPPPPKEVSIQEPFPQKLYRLLIEAEENDETSIVSFMPSGTSFHVHDRDAFMEKVSPRYFRHAKFASFKRQMYLYDFTQVREGPEKGAYHHPLFQRGRPELLEDIPRVSEGFVRRQIQRNEQP